MLIQQIIIYSFSQPLLIFISIFYFCQAFLVFHRFFASLLTSFSLFFPIIFYAISLYFCLAHEGILLSCFFSQFTPQSKLLCFRLRFCCKILTSSKSPSTSVFISLNHVFLSIGLLRSNSIGSGLNILNKSLLFSIFLSFLFFYFYVFPSLSLYSQSNYLSSLTPPILIQLSATWLSIIFFWTVMDSDDYQSLYAQLKSKDFQLFSQVEIQHLYQDDYVISDSKNTDLSLQQIF